MANIFQVSPGQTVNKGLATTYKSTYPQQIALLQDYQKQKRADDQLAKAQADADYDWFSEKEYATKGLDKYDAGVVRENWDKISTIFEEGQKKGLRMRRNGDFQEMLRQGKTDAIKRQSATATLAQISAQTKPGGELEKYHRGKMASALAAETKAAREEGRVPDYQKFLGEAGDALLDGDRLGKTFAGAHTQGKKQYLDTITDEGGDVRVLKSFIDSDIYERDEKTGVVKYFEGKPILKDEMPDEMLESIRVDNPDYHKWLIQNEKDGGGSYADQAYADFVENTNALSPTIESYRAMTDGGSSAAETESKNAGELYTSLFQNLLPSAKAEDRSWSMNQFSDDKIKFENVGNNKIRVIAKKEFLTDKSIFDSVETPTKEMLNSFGGKNLTADEVVSGYIDLTEGIQAAASKMWQIKFPNSNMNIQTAILNRKRDIDAWYGENMPKYDKLDLTEDFGGGVPGTIPIEEEAIPRGKYGSFFEREPK